MTPQQKQSDLQRYRIILLATLDYLEERLGGSIVFDQYDVTTEYYQQQKAQTEKYFKQRKLDRLQQRLASFTKEIQSRSDLTFASYIKEKTGYEIDIFEELRKRIDIIVAQHEIRSQHELNDVGTMLHYYHKTAVEKREVEELELLLADYSRRTNEMPRKRKGEYSEVISSVEKDGLEEVTVRSSSGPKPKHFEEQMVISPDGKRKLRVVQWGSKNITTYVAVEFPAANGAVYGLNGICPDVKAWWKDNSSIVIETKKEYYAHTQYKQVRSFDDIITIDYIEYD